MSGASDRKPVGLMIDSMLRLVEPAARRTTSAEIPRLLIDSVRHLQARGLTFILVRDDYRMAGSDSSVPRLDPFLAAAHVSRIDGQEMAFVIESDVSLYEPFHLAKNLASLDHALDGRLGWLPRYVADPTSSQAVSLGEQPDKDPAAHLAEYRKVVQGLWDTWEDGAIIRDVDTGRYIDPDRVHILRYESTRFQVRGPLLVPRSPQGRVPTFGFMEDHDGPGAEAPTPDLLVTATARPDVTAPQLRLVSAEEASVEALNGFAGGVIDMGDGGLAGVIDALGRMPGCRLDGRSLREVFGLGAAHNVFRDESVQGGMQ